MRGINLIPQEFFETQDRNQRLRVWLLIMSATAAALLMLGVHAHRQLRAERDDLLSIKSTLARISSLRNELKALSMNKTLLEEETAAVDRLFQHSTWSVGISEIAAASRDRVMLSTLSAGPGGAAPPPRVVSTTVVPLGATQPVEQKDIRRSMVLSGYAVSNVALAEYLTALAESPRLGNANLEFSRLAALGGVDLLEFEIHCDADDDLSNGATP